MSTETPLTDADVARLVALADAATPGPWAWDDEGFMGCGQVWTQGEGVEGGSIAGPTGDCYPRGGYSPKEDMQFIAAANPATIKALAARVEALRQRIAELQVLTSPRKSEAVASLVRSSTRLVQIERDAARAEVDALHVENQRLLAQGCVGPTAPTADTPEREVIDVSDEGGLAPTTGTCPTCGTTPSGFDGVACGGASSAVLEGCHVGESPEQAETKQSLETFSDRAERDALRDAITTLVDKWDAAMGPRVLIDRFSVCDGCAEGKRLVVSYPTPDSEPWLCQECDDEGRQEIRDIRELLSEAGERRE